ncbi:type IV conjugative transfer system protein TraE [Chlamydiales bacterium]|nr:type IV conjugative transfer system protein TraE [Chlamydiales bacterium]
MNAELFQSNIRSLKFQRNVFLSLCLILSITTACLSVFSFTKRERTLVVPPVIEKAFWVDSNRVSPEYLEQFGLFLAQQILSKSFSSAKTQMDTVMRYASPSFSGTLFNKLEQEILDLKEKKAAYSFFTSESYVDANKLELILVGDRHYFSDGHLISKEQDAYKFRFSFNGSMLFLEEIESGKKQGGRRA